MRLTLSEPKLLIFKAMVLSFLAHCFILKYFVFTFTVTAPPSQTFFAFLGSILNEHDIIRPIYSPKHLNQISTISMTIKYATPKATQPSSNRKPKFFQDKTLNKKIYLKSTFLEPQTQGVAKPTPTEKNLRINLEEPLHTPLKLNSHDHN